MSNPRNSTRARRICWNTHKTVHVGTGEQVMICHECKQYIDPIRDQWRADHIVRHAEGGEDTPDNLWPIHISCDAGQAVCVNAWTAPSNDVEQAKGKPHDRDIEH